MFWGGRAKKAASKRAASKKAASKRAASKRAAPRRAASKRAASKRAASKRAVSKRGRATKTRTAPRRVRQSKKVRTSRRSGKRPLNEYFTKMLDAKKNNLPEFGYKGNSYKQFTTKTGLTSYKRA
jgi:hypothetical protein